MEDKFRLNNLGDVVIKPSDEALAVKKAYQNGPKYSSDTILPFDEAFSSDAPADSVLQYTQYKGKTFEWVLLNALSFIFYLFDRKFDSLKSNKDKTLHSFIRWCRGRSHFLLLNHPIDATKLHEILMNVAVKYFLLDHIVE